jgi:hypothetical protein
MDKTTSKMRVCHKRRNYFNTHYHGRLDTGWAKMRESTASAPGGHYRHYKTASVAARLLEEHPDHYYELACIYAVMCSLPLKHGFSPSHWQRCVDAILEKIQGQPRIEKLHIIMLCKANFNFVLKLIWGKRLVKNAEYHKALGTLNHGSRPGQQCTDAWKNCWCMSLHGYLTHLWLQLTTMQSHAMIGSSRRWQ